MHPRLRPGLREVISWTPHHELPGVFLMKLRMRHLAAIFIAVGTFLVATLLWWLWDRLLGLGVVGLVAVTLLLAVQRIRRRPEYHERKRLYLRLEEWTRAHSCGDLLEVDGRYVQCCPHLTGPHVRLWLRHPGSRHVPIDEYSLRNLVPIIRHSTLLGTLNGSGVLDAPQPTKLRAVIHRGLFEQDSGVIDTTVDELQGLLDQLDRATPVFTRP